MRLTDDERTKLVLVITQRGINFLSAELKMPIAAILNAYARTEDSEDDTKRIGAWIREFVITDVPVSKVRVPISTT